MVIVLLVVTSLAANTRFAWAATGDSPDTCGWVTVVPGSNLPANGAPPGRLLHSVIYDDAHRQLVIFGGDGDNGPLPGARQRNDTWSLALHGVPTWTELHPDGALPSKRRGHTAIFDAQRSRMLLLGGIDFDDRGHPTWPDDSAAVWSLPLSDAPAWSVLQTSGPSSPRRFAHAVAYDPSRQRMWFYGGQEQLGGLDFSARFGYLRLDGTPTWVEVPAAGTHPPGLVEHGLVYDRLRDRLLLFGGIQAGTAAPLRDVWQCDLTGTPTWLQLLVAGNPPEDAEAEAVRTVYDPVGDQLVVVGPTSVQTLVLSGTPTWRPARPHPERYGIAVAYDSAGARVLQMGGDSGPLLNDVFELSVPPTARLSVAPDSAGTVSAVYGGACPDAVTLTAVSAHGFEFRGWSGDANGESNPITVTLDAQKYVVAHFGVSTATLISRFEAIRVATGIELRWSFGDPSRIAAVAIDRRRVGDRSWQSIALEVHSEAGSEVALDSDVHAGVGYDYQLRVSLVTGEVIEVGPVSAEMVALPDITTIESVVPNPSPGRMTMVFTLARDGPVRLAVMDVAGREVTRLIDGAHQRGRYQASWDGTARCRLLPAGLYFARLTTGDRTVARRLVLSR